MIRLAPRQGRSPYGGIAATAAALLATVATGGLIFAALGHAPLETLVHFLVSPFGRADRVADLFVKAAPLITISLGLIVCYRANIWNIGAEGQFILGALAAGMLALGLPDATSPLLLPGMMLVAVLAGAAWAGVAAAMRAHFKANEILVTLMLSYVAGLLLDYMVRGPLRDPQSFGFPLTRAYPDAGLIDRMPLPLVGQVGQLHYGVLLALALTPVAWLALNRSLPGYQVKVAGLAPRAGRFAGFDETRIVYGAMLVSGGLAGLAGMVEVSANIGQLQPNVSFGYGFTAIIVAFLARLNPLATVPAGLLIAVAELGGDNAQIALGIPQVVSGMFKGILLFYLLVGATLQHYRIEFGRAGSGRGGSGRGGPGRGEQGRPA